MSQLYFPENNRLAEQIPMNSGNPTLNNGIANVIGLMHDERAPRNTRAIDNNQAVGMSGTTSSGGANQNNSNETLAATTTVSGTTEFVNDANEKVQSVRHTSLDASMAVPRMDDNTIGLFMSKPVGIQNLTWTSALGRNSILYSAGIAEFLTGSAVPTIWKNKISGYNLMRGTAVLKIVANGQPFQAGRLLIHFLPQAASFAAYSSTYVNNHNLTICSKTQQPNVELDLADGTATLEIPYIAPTLWHSRTNPYDWGSFYITVLSPLASAASATVYLNVFLYFKDFELAGPIFGPEMNMELTKKQSRERKRTNKTGVVSTFFDAVAKPFDMLRTVPIIGSVSGAVADTASSVSGLFSLFGWSRPFDTKSTQLVRSHNMYQAFNFNGVNASDVLAMDSLNQLAPMENFAGSSVDEMSFSYLKAIPAYFTSVSWSTSQASGTAIYSLDASLKPLVDAISVASGTTNVTALTAPPFVYLSRFFKYYRGSIIITVKIVKTQFHSGRLSVEFTPSTSNFPTSGGQDASYVYRDIIDVKESDTYSFTLPYMHPAPFLNTGWEGVSANEETAFGHLTIRVLNPLVAASTVSSSIDVLLYAQAGDDFMLSVLNPISTFCFQPEMNTDLPRIAGPIGDAPSHSTSVVPLALCTGEAFLSIKQLLQCARPLSGPANMFQSGGAVDGARIYPFSIGMFSNQGATVNPRAIDVSYLSGDFISELAPGFVYSRGGVRYIAPETYNAGSFLTWIENIPNDGTEQDFVTGAPSVPAVVSSTITTPGFHLMPPVSVRPCAGGGMDTIFPHLGQTPMRLNYVQTVLGSSKIPTSIDSPDFYLAMYQNGGGYNFTFTNFFRSGADDYALGYFIGFPPFCSDFSS